MSGGLRDAGPTLDKEITARIEALSDEALYDLVRALITATRNGMNPRDALCVALVPNTSGVGGHSTQEHP